MKKRVILALALAAFLLIACTMLSTKIEEEMLTQVASFDIPPKPAGKYEINLPMWYLHNEGDTMDTEKFFLSTDFSQCDLYQLEEGVGWEEGLRIRAVEKDAYRADALAGGITGADETRGWRFVTYASRPPKDGLKAEVLEKEELGLERYLVYYPDGIPADAVPSNNMTILKQEGNTLLISLNRAPKTMLPERARRQMGTYGVKGVTMYSLSAMEQFLENLPKIAGVICILFAGAAVWVQSCFLLANDWENRWYLRLNACFGVILLLALYALLKRIDLPASLLPRENILELSHYSRIFGQALGSLRGFNGNLFESLNNLGEHGQKVLNLHYTMVKDAKITLAVGLILPVLWAVLPIFLRRKGENHDETGTD